MEKRSAVHVILLAAGLVLALAIGVLALKVRAPSAAPELDPAELAQAQARAARSAAPGNRPTPPASAPAWVPRGRDLQDLAGAPDPSPTRSPDVSLERLGAAGLAGAAAGGAVAAEDAEEDPATLPAKMTEASRLYDRGDYEGARVVADEVLAEQPDNVKMLRVAVSCACIMGEPDRARTYYDRLPERDQRQMARRCRRYGVEF